MVSPSGATIETNGRTATITWTPTTAERASLQNFRVFVDDEGGLSDAVQFSITVNNALPVLDLNGSATGQDSEVELAEGATSVALLDSDFSITDADGDTLTSATIRLRGLVDGVDERLSIDTSGSNITQSFNQASGILTLTGEDTISNFVNVLRTLRYENDLAEPTPNNRSVDITVDDGTSGFGGGVSQLVTITIDFEGENVNPTLTTIQDVTVIAGSPLFVPLDAADTDGDTLSFTASASDTTVLTTDIPEGNRSLRFSVENFGDMVFELYDHLAPRATDRIATLAEQGFYDGITFHRVVDGFVIQAGDPTGTGTSGSTLGDFDDQFHVDLQHNQTGILSMAKTTDDTNDSQFFITEGATRHLDFNHSIFGQLIEGESVREAISNVTVGAGSRPVSDVVIQSAEVFVDAENGILQLSAPEGVTGSTTVTVNVSDNQGGTATQTFNVNIVADVDQFGSNINGNPFLDDVPTLSTPVDTTVTHQLTAQDVEGDSFVFLDQTAIDAINDGILPELQIQLPARSAAAVEYSVDPTTGLLTVTPSSGITGAQLITVAVAASVDGLTVQSAIDFQVVEINVG